MNILYYSNHCPHSNKILNKLSKSLIKEDFSFISLDNRYIDNDKIFVKLRNNESIELNNNIDKVPALMLESYGNRILFGNDIQKFIETKEREQNINTENNEPSPFSFSFSNNDNVVSDCYSFLDIPNSEFSAAEGNAGVLQPFNYSYASIDQDSYMNTPPDNYVPDKISNEENLLDKLVEERNKDVPLPTSRI